MPNYCDLHLHLGGSISPALARRFARSDHDRSALDALSAADVLTLFKVVHRLVRSPARIETATEDVINQSTADYLEIRTTPRAFSSGGSLHPYVDAFAAALRRYPGKARGLLSVDRYAHDLTRARDIIALARAYPDCIVGIDISGVTPPPGFARCRAATWAYALKPFWPALWDWQSTWGSLRTKRTSATTRRR